MVRRARRERAWREELVFMSKDGLAGPIAVYTVVVNVVS